MGIIMVHLNYAMTPMENVIEIDFWEFICVDRGDVNITAGENKLTLHKDEIAFHEPMEFHDVCTSPHSAPNLIVVSFECHSPAMDFFRKKVLTIDQEERVLLSSVLREARGCFASRLDDPYLDHLVFRSNQEEGSQQMLLLSLTAFLIHLKRRTSKEERKNIERRTETMCPVSLKIHLSQQFRCTVPADLQLPCRTP